MFQALYIVNSFKPHNSFFEEDAVILPVLWHTQVHGAYLIHTRSCKYILVSEYIVLYKHNSDLLFMDKETEV